VDAEKIYVALFVLEQDDEGAGGMIMIGKAPFLLFLLIAFSGCRQDAAIVVVKEQETASSVAVSPYLISVSDVAALIGKAAAPLIIEVSKAERFGEGHLPGAVNTWRPDYEAAVAEYPYGGIRASREKMAKLLSRLGAKADDLIIAYCTKGGADAARLQWILRSYGHERVAIMDGGKEAWKLAGYPLTCRLAPKRSSTNYQFMGPIREDYFATLAEVVAAVTDTSVLLLDVREEYEYLGLPYVTHDSIARFKSGAFTYGSIPTARHLNWSEAVNLHSDHSFKSLADLNHNFLARGVSPDKDIIVYCQSGVRSAHTTFVLRELLGYPKVSNYDGSWIEWSYIHALDTLGMLQRHTTAERIETAYQELQEDLQQSKN